MKTIKSILGLIIGIVLLATCATSGNLSTISLHEAIERSAERISGELPKGSRVAIVAFTSTNDNLSDYIMEELTGALFDRGIEVADRQNLEYVFQELNFQISGMVSDDTAKSVGRFLAADMVITGDLTDLNSLFRYRTSAINVETAVRASVTRQDVNADNTTRRMLATITNQQSTTRTTRYGVSENIMPQTAGAFLDRGIMFASRGQYNKAIADFDNSVSMNPNIKAVNTLRENLEARIFEGNGHSYRVINQSISWTDARRYAEERGGYLATITSRDEQAFIENLLTRDGNRIFYWIGGYCSNDRIWRWITGEPLSFTNWMPGEPNNSGNREDRLQILRVPHPDASTSRLGQWNDGYDEFNIYTDTYLSNLGFIIEWSN